MANVSALFSKVFERPKSEDLLRWQFFPDPALAEAPAFAVVGLGDRLVAGQGFHLRPACLDGQLVEAGESVDSMVDAGFRGRGFFRLVYEAASERVKALGVPVIYGIPNQNSYVPLVRFGFSEPFHLHRRVIILKPLGLVLSRFGLSSATCPNIKPEAERRIHTTLDRLGGAPQAKFIIQRSPDYWNHRFVRHPTRKYDPRSTPDGAYVLRFDGAGGRRGAALCDIAVRDYLSPGPLRRLLVAVMKYARTQGAQTLSCWCIRGSAFDRTIARLGGIRRRKSHFPVMFKRLDGGEMPPLTAANTFMTGGDFDLV